MNVSTITLQYNQHAMEAVQFGGQMWLRVDQIAPPLGFTHSRNVRLVYERNSEEFTNDETRIVNLPSAGGAQEVRVFSLRGTRLLALLARTPEAKAFRRWVLDLLDGRMRRQPAQGALSLPGTFMLPKDTVEALDEVAALLELDHPARALVQELIEGRRAVSDNPALLHLVSRLEGARNLHGEANRMYSDIARQAQRMGFSLEAVKSEAKRQRRLPQLPDVGDA
jgi:prophage antirepressor-like protein